MSEYRLTRQAKHDIDCIWDDIGDENDNPAAADKLVLRLHQAFDRLARSPGSGHRRDDLSPGLRVFPVGNYVVFYHPAPDGIDVAGIVHSRRNWTEMFEDGERQSE